MSAPEPPAASLASSELKSLEALDRYLSLPLVLGLLAAATFLIAWNPGIALLYALFAVLVGVGLLSVVGARRVLRRPTVGFDLPRDASLGHLPPVRVPLLSRARPRRRH